MLRDVSDVRRAMCVMPVDVTHAASVMGTGTHRQKAVSGTRARVDKPTTSSHSCSSLVGLHVMPVPMSVPVPEPVPAPVAVAVAVAV